MMSSELEGTETYWFVGSYYVGSEDPTPRFLQQGIWENGYQDKYLDDVRSVRVGDRIAIKSSYTRKNHLPFDNQGQHISVMAIKAIGTVTENLGDGRTLKVDWQPLNPPREWYFHTNRSTIWRVVPGDWASDALIEFAFEGKPQDIERFRKNSGQNELFSADSGNHGDFQWIPFYEEFADKLLTFRNRRDELMAGIHAIENKIQHGMEYLHNPDNSESGTLLKDICPFTVMGIFNRGTNSAKRKTIARELANLLGVSTPVPDSFDGIPILNALRSWFCGYFDDMWEVFARAIAFADSDNPESRAALITAYDNAVPHDGVGWNLTMGLYWIRPRTFPTLDGSSRIYINNILNIPIEMNGPKRRCNAEDYLKVQTTLEARFQEETCPVHSFTELSYAAWLFSKNNKATAPSDTQDEEEESPTVTGDFQWVPFYEEFADKLLTFRNRRDELMAGIHAIAQKVPGMEFYKNESHTEKTGIPFNDTCPFTVMGMFNRGIKNDNRKLIAKELGDFLGVSTPVPDSFEEIPVINSVDSLFFGAFRDPVQRHTSIEALWEIFARAIAFADSDNAESRAAFIAAIDRVSSDLSKGFYWIRPRTFLSLDGRSKHYIRKKLDNCIAKNCPDGLRNGSDYLKVVKALEARFQEETCPVHSFPELSFAAWIFSKNNKAAAPSDAQDEEDDDDFTAAEDSYTNSSQLSWRETIVNNIKLLCRSKNSATFSLKDFYSEFLAQLEKQWPDKEPTKDSIRLELRKLRDINLLEFFPDKKGVYRWLGDYESSDEPSQSIQDPYSVDDILEEGCFVPREKLEKILERLRTKKNLILQGPPGTGKTWLAKRLAFALIGQKDKSKVRAVQFHPNLSYEDFIRGWRPAGDGKLTLVDGPFVEMIKAALNDPNNTHVVVIEEINRGNPAQIFGEMLTLLEADKRKPQDALELSYKRADSECVYIPDNLHVIGTMNIADRSLALVDLALRRRFAFIDLEPALGKPWREWLQRTHNFDSDFLDKIETRFLTLNNNIAQDKSLGSQFRLGHSYVTPPSESDIADAPEWYRQVVESEIGPLLDEYWFDDLEKSQKARTDLLEGFGE